MTTYALNGLGRIGKLALRALIESGEEIAFLNDAVGNAEMHAHLLEFDTVHGRWAAEFAYAEGEVSINGRQIALHNTRRIEDLPLAGVDVVIDCTGASARRGPFAAAGFALSKGETLGQGESIRFSTPSGHVMELVADVEKVGTSRRREPMAPEPSCCAAITRWA